MALWLWVGGGIMAFGTILAAWPGRRRRPTDPTSAPIGVAGSGPGDGDTDGDAGPMPEWSDDRPSGDRVPAPSGPPGDEDRGPVDRKSTRLNSRHYCASRMTS